MTSVAVTLGFGMILGFRITASPLSAAAGCLLVLAFALAMCWFSALIGLMVKSAQGVQWFGFLVMFPLVFGSNLLVKTATMPGWLQAFVKVNPMTYLTEAERGLLTGGPAGTPALRSLLWALGIFIVFAPLAVRVYRRRPDQLIRRPHRRPRRSLRRGRRLGRVHRRHRTRPRRARSGRPRALRERPGCPRRRHPGCVGRAEQGGRQRGAGSRIRGLLEGEGGDRIDSGSQRWAFHPGRGRAQRGSEQFAAADVVPFPQDHHGQPGRGWARIPSHHGDCFWSSRPGSRSCGRRGHVALLPVQFCATGASPAPASLRRVLARPGRVGLLQVGPGLLRSPILSRRAARSRRCRKGPPTHLAPGRTSRHLQGRGGGRVVASELGRSASWISTEAAPHESPRARNAASESWRSDSARSMREHPAE